MTSFRSGRALAWCMLAVLALGCRQQSPVPASSNAADTPPAPAAGIQDPVAAVALKDVVETSPEYILGISYPQGMEKYPGLAQALLAYADGERKLLADAVAARQGAAGGLPYDMSLSFVTALETPRLVVVKADGSRYAGGEHGQPLLRRFVWLPDSGELLQAERLLDPAGWQVVAEAVRERLATRLATDLEDDNLAPADHAAAMRAGLAAIQRDTPPQAEAFAQFEPVLGDDGRIRALRFVFPPWQEWNYAQDQHGAEVPASVLLPHVMPAYRALFAGG